MEHFANLSLSVVIAKCCLLGFEVRNPDLDNRIFDCLLISIAAVQVEDVCAFFLFVGDLNAIIRCGWVIQP